MLDEGTVYEWGEMSVRPGETDTRRKPVLSMPCLLRGEIQGVKIVDMACGALHALLLSGIIGSSLFLVWQPY